MSKEELPVVAIIGRPNVGKSSLFNRIIGRRISIVHEDSGVTRDRVSSFVRLEGKRFILTDTGGLAFFSDDTKIPELDASIRKQVDQVIEEADILIWLLDSQNGLTQIDQGIEQKLRECSNSKIIVAVNKADNQRSAEAAANEFAALSFNRPILISCSHDAGISSLQKELVALLPNNNNGQTTKPELKIAITGRPNVGKSSLTNALLGEPRVMVSSSAGTTRDAVDIPVEIEVNEEETAFFTLIDTAGMRRKKQVDSAVEVFSIMRSENAIRRGDIVLLVLDATNFNSAQDRRIARIIEKSNKPCVIVANKWDIAGNNIKMRQLRSEIERSLPFMNYAPIVTVCSLSGYNIQELLSALFELQEQAQLKIPTSVINQFLHDTLARTPPPAEGKKRFKFFYATMVNNPPPRFLLFVNNKKLCRANYRQFLKNQIQNAFFPKSGLPVSIELRSRRDE